MRFLSVCSGIEAASVAWGPLGWQAAAFSEIEPFPCAVLAHHYPDVPNLGDMTTIAQRILNGEAEAPDVLAGGTPCQAFSVAGLRKSLADERGNLTMKFVEIADAIDSVRVRDGLPPAIVFWENVPGVLSTKDNAFGCFLAGLAGEDEPLQPPGGKWANAGAVYGPARAIAWRVLDAQYFGLAQRRRRVFVVASARNGFDPAAVLFEFEGVRRDSPPSREARQVAPTIPARSTGGGGLGTDFDCDGGLIHADQIARCITAGEAKRQDWETCNFVAHALRVEGFDASEDGTGRGTPLVHAICFDDPRRFDTKGIHGGCEHGDLHPTLESTNPKQIVAFYHTQDPVSSTDGSTHAQGVAVAQPVVYAFQTGNLVRGAGSQPSADVFPTLKADHGRGLSDQHPCVAVAFAQNSRNEVRLEGGDGQRTGALSTGGGKPGQGVPMIAFHPTQDPISSTDGSTHALGCGSTGGQASVAVAVALRGRGGGATAELGDEVQNCLRASSGGGDKPHVLTAMQVRRLTPRECERLQGFPDDYTAIPWRGKPASECPDGQRYKALGNSWAVPVVRWIGERINAAVEQIKHERKAP